MSFKKNATFVIKALASGFRPTYMIGLDGSFVGTSGALTAQAQKDQDYAQMATIHKYSVDTFKAFVKALKAKTAVSVERAGDKELTLTTDSGATCKLTIESFGVQPESVKPFGDVTYSVELDAVTRRALEAHRSTDEFRTNINAVYFHKGCAVATDGHRLMRAKVNALKPCEGFEALVPGGDFKALSAFGKNAVLTADFDGSCVRFTDGERVVLGSGRTAGFGDFPDYQKVIPTQNLTLLGSFTAKDLLAKLAALPTPKRDQVCAKVSQDAIEAKHLGIETRIPISLAQNPNDYFCVNALYLKGAVETYGDSTINLYVGADKLSPIKIAAQLDETSCTVIMPITVRD